MNDSEPDEVCHCGLPVEDHKYPGAAEHNFTPKRIPKTVRVVCQDCDSVVVEGGIYEGGRPISGLCPGCGDRLYFA